jgi:predicted TIM-barrel fold metal-dependent hydrolase
VTSTETEHDLLTEIPMLISVDDHVVEPPGLWWDRLPEPARARGPHVERVKGRVSGSTRGGFLLVDEAPDAPDASWVDLWVYEDLRAAIPSGMMQVHQLRDATMLNLTIYDDLPPGVWQQEARLADMDLNHTEASLMFPTVPRFCGQTFLERDDKDLALECVKIYNDWMIDEWCGGAGRGRIIPMTLLPMWDSELCAAETLRCAAKGSHAVSFSECPPWLGLPSIFSDYWHPLWRACEETECAVNMHIGSSSHFGEQRGDDVPPFVGKSMSFQNSLLCLGDWLASGLLERFKTLKIVLSEGQVGWIPFVVGRFDNEWELAELWEPRLHERVPRPPSTYLAGRVYGCIFDDLAGLSVRDQIGMSQIMWENDYPHGDTSFPHSKQMAEKLIGAAGLDARETWQLLRGNAIECYRLETIGISQ